MTQQAHLRKGKTDPKGYGAVDTARNMLNEMIYEAMTKYDNEISRCVSYYSAHCAEMEEQRGQVASSNEIAANARALILDAQGTINMCEVHIPTTNYHLK